MAKRVALKMKPDAALRAVDQAKELLKRDQADLEARLEAGVIAGLMEDAGILAQKASGAYAARAQKTALTQKQNLTATQVIAMVMAIRAALKDGGVSKELRKAAGVGAKATSRSVSSAKAAADMIAQAYAAYADEMRAVGVLPADVETLTGLASALQTADAAQESKKVASKVTTTQRNTAQRRAEAALAKIIGAAELAFVFADPERVKQYRALIPARPKRKPKKPVAQ